MIDNGTPEPLTYAEREEREKSNLMQLCQSLSPAHFHKAPIYDIIPPQVSLYLANSGKDRVCVRVCVSMCVLKDRTEEGRSISHNHITSDMKRKKEGMKKEGAGFGIFHTSPLLSCMEGRL